ncbi:hypothetical protein DLAC_07654 [Tieghemostelium lacteum]|uniref:Uncharacterized protein n=1 Tax=Tieghemostelium lacteum TaxID=361077 RepID=A0A151ZD44_TIELA|nr:hypothetical protein DLAC_07654 [Tieghemostelium lacteum]|eukprot:KYQ91849.1 hypothetical protein DLAC_07654 [Tieghemostelium lacteum]
MIFNTFISKNFLYYLSNSKQCQLSKLLEFKKLIEDVKYTRIECDWINDQTEASFKSMIEKGENDFLYLELVWAIGKELSNYVNDIQWPQTCDKKESKQLLESFQVLLKQCDLISASLLANQNTFENRLTILESLFLQLQLLQLDLFNDEVEQEEDDSKRDGNEEADIEMKDVNDQQIMEEEEIVNSISVLSEIFSVEFQNISNLATTLQDIYLKIKETLVQLPEDYISEPFFKNTVFSDSEKKEIQELSEQLYNDYRMRFDVLIKRMNVTVDSLLWSERVEGKVEDIKRSVKYLKSSFPSITQYTFLDLISVHRDILKIIKTSSQSNATKLTNSVIIGKVPDRGGRPGDRKAAMPSFQKRVEYSNQHQHNKKGKRNK